MEEFKQQSELDRLTYLSEGCTLDEKNQFILSDDLINEGWKVGISFQNASDENIVSEEINRLKRLRYEVKGLMVKGMENIKCLIYKEI